MIPSLVIKLLAVSVGIAPTESHFNAFSSSIFNSASAGSGLYVPIISIKAPSLLVLESATTIR